MIEIEIISISIAGDFPLIRINDHGKANYVNKPIKLVVDQITLEDLVEF